MTTPGSNLLASAFGAIQTSEVKWLKFIGRKLNDVGQYVESLAPPVLVQASVQPVNKKAYIQLGLDMKREYVNVYACINATDLDREVAGDRFVTKDGVEWQVQNKNDWYTVDGWVVATCIKVPSQMVRA